MSAQASLNMLRARIAGYRVSLQLERDAEAARDVEIRRLRGLGWSYVRIGAAVDLTTETTRRRALAMGLSGRAVRYNPFQADLTPAEREAYLVYLHKGWSGAEARAVVLAARRKAA